MRAWQCELAIVQGLKTLRINKVMPFDLELIVYFLPFIGQLLSQWTANSGNRRSLRREERI